MAIRESFEVVARLEILERDPYGARCELFLNGEAGTESLEREKTAS